MICHYFLVTKNDHSVKLSTGFQAQLS